MKFLVNKTEKLSGTISIPGNKSGTARALILGALAEGESTIRNPLHNADSYSILHMLEGMGASFDTTDDNLWRVHGTGGKLSQPVGVLDAGNSGTGYYCCTWLAATIPAKSVMTGDYQICYRPAGPLVAAANELGAEIISTRDNGLAPLWIRGGFRGGKRLRFPGHNSQWYTGLMMAGSLQEGDIDIDIDGETLEKPYVAMTIGMMEQAGVHVVNDGYRHYKIIGGQHYRAADFVIPGDWGSSGYPSFAAAITCSTATFLNLNREDYAGEREFADILRRAGCTVDDVEGGIRVTGSSHLVGQTIDCSGMPDAVPILAVYGCACKEGKTVLTNIRGSRLKETDRTKIIRQQLERMGGRFEEDENNLVIYPSRLKGAFIDGHHDHRIVMATAVAALIADGPTIIDNAEFAAVSYPEFYDQMKALGADIQRLEVV